LLESHVDDAATAISDSAVTDCGTKQRRPSGSGAFRELADDPLGDISLSTGLPTL
jgi:hypothetical protein